MMIMHVTDKPSLTDVLLGRGVATNRHPGNENFRSIVSQYIDIYVTSTKKQKSMISRAIVEKVKTELSPPGRFLTKNAMTGLWQEVDDKRAAEKTAQALRDGAAPLRKALLEDMNDPAFLNDLFEDGDVGCSDKPSATKSKKLQRRKRASCSLTHTAKKQRLDTSIPVEVQADNALSIAHRNVVPPMFEPQQQTHQVHQQTLLSQQLPAQWIARQLSFKPKIFESQQQTSYQVHQQALSLPQHFQAQLVSQLPVHQQQALLQSQSPVSITPTQDNHVMQNSQHMHNIDGVELKNGIENILSWHEDFRVM